MTSRWRVLVVSLLAFAIAAAVHGSFHAWVPTGARVRPILAVVPWVFTFVGVVAAMISGSVMMRDAVGVVRKVGMLVLHVSVSMGGVVGTLTSDPQFPLGSTYVDDLELPDDRGRVYLYRGGLFCSQELWIAEPGRWILQHHPELGSYDCNHAGVLQWDAALGRVRVVDAKGDSLPPPEWVDGMARGIDWRPH